MHPCGHLVCFFHKCANVLHSTRNRQAPRSHRNAEARQKRVSDILYDIFSPAKEKQHKQALGAISKDISDFLDLGTNKKLSAEEVSDTAWYLEEDAEKQTKVFSVPGAGKIVKMLFKCIGKAHLQGFDPEACKPPRDWKGTPKCTKEHPCASKGGMSAAEAAAYVPPD